MKKLLLIAALTATAATTWAQGPNVTITGKLRTPTISTATANGTVAAGTRNVTFIFSSTFTGSILGVAYAGSTDASQTFNAGSADALAEIAYTVTAGSLRIVEVR